DLGITVLGVLRALRDGRVLGHPLCGPVLGPLTGAAGLRGPLGDVDDDPADTSDAVHQIDEGPRRRREVVTGRVDEEESIHASRIPRSAAEPRPPCGRRRRAAPGAVRVGYCGGMTTTTFKE